MTFSKMKQSAQCRELNIMLYTTGKIYPRKKEIQENLISSGFDDSAKSKLCLFLYLKKRFFLRFESENIFIKVTRH